MVQSGRVEDGMLIAGIIAFTGFIGIANALRKPGLRKALLPVSVVIGLGLALFFARLPVLFADVNHERYFSLRRLANDVHVWQSQLHADSGYYAAVSDTSILPRLYRGGLLDLRLERTSDGYRA